MSPYSLSVGELQCTGNYGHNLSYLCIHIRCRGFYRGIYFHTTIHSGKVVLLKGKITIVKSDTLSGKKPAI